jgi:conjugative transfer signal peptidase TraF
VPAGQLKQPADDRTQVAVVPSKQRQPRWPLVVIALFLLFAMLATIGRRLVVMNPTDSVDPGLYLAVPGADIEVGRLVSLRLPESTRVYFADKAGRPLSDASGWYLVKPVSAGPGDEVDTTGSRVFINGIDYGPIYTHDSTGRALPQWRERRVLGEGEWLLISRRSPGSLDGRYFGPIRESDIEHVRRPLLRWGGDDGNWQWFGSYMDRPPEQVGASGEGVLKADECEVKAEGVLQDKDSPSPGIYGIAGQALIDHTEPHSSYFGMSYETGTGMSYGGGR